MKDTAFYLTEGQLSRLATSYRRNKTGRLEATAIRILDGKSPASRDRFPRRTAGYYSTAADYAKFCQMVLNGGEFEGRRYLRRKSVNSMTSVDR